MNNLLKARRLELGLTLEEVGNQLGVGKSTVRKWEQGMIENMGRDKIVALSKALKISPIDILEVDISETLTSIYNQLNPHRQQKVYNYAERQLDEQNIVIDINKYIKNDIEDDLVEEVMEGYLSAGTGEFLAEDIKQPIMIHKSLLPEKHYDMILQVNGDSMEPMFRNKEYIFVRKTEDLRSGQIGVFIIDGKSYLKKVYINDDYIKLVSLNHKYDDLIFSDVNDIKVIGTVVM